jgi:rhamnosyl/mannosyltransferase
MKILHIYKDYYPVLGGMENHIKLLAEGQVKQGLEVTVLVTNNSFRSVLQNINGVQVVKAGRLATIASTPLSLSLPLLLRQQRPDIAHLHFPYPVGELSYLLFGRASHMVITYHSDIVRQKTLLLFYRPFLWQVLRRADRIIATSPNYIESSPYLRPLKHKCRVVPLSIEIERFLDADPSQVQQIRAMYGSPLILFVGKLRYYKGLHYLLRAMPEIPGKLLIIGEGPMESDLRQLIISLNLSGKVFFLGEVSDEELPAYYHACDVFVLPASERSEAFGTVQIEAMASGLPVVCTELGTGTSFVNVHGKTGLVVPARDSAVLATAILSLLGDEQLRQEMGRNARERALQEFSLQTMVDRITKLYEEIMRNTGFKGSSGQGFE